MNIFLQLNSINGRPKGPFTKLFNLLIVVLAVAFYAFFIARTSFQQGDQTHFTLIDDAMISMRYAQHLATGQGITWNIGQPPIQGYTNPGWMLYMAGLHLLPVSASTLCLLVMITNLVVLVLNICVVQRITARLAPESRVAPALSAMIVTFYFPLVFWSLRGMEVGLACLLVDIAALLCLRLMDDARWPIVVTLAGIMLLAFIVRVDTILQMSIIAMFSVLAAYRQKRLVCITRTAIVLIALGLLLIILQASYFGSAIPNTYYLKVTGVTLFERMLPGANHLVSVTQGDIALPLLVVAACALFHRKVLLELPVIMLLCLFAIQTAYSVYVGGDSGEYAVGGANRFIAQGMPALIVVFVVTLQDLFHWIRGPMQGRLPVIGYPAVLYAGISAVVLMSGNEWVKWAKYNAPALDSDIHRMKLGVLIHQNTDEQTRVAVHAAGQIPYYSARYTIDMLGKNDRVIAKGPPAGPFIPGHNKWNYAYSIMELKPDLVADEWGCLRQWMERNGNGYFRLPNGIWVNTASTHVVVGALSQGVVP